MTKSCSVSAVVIPARLASTRLPRKLLLDTTGKPLLQHTFEAASAAQLPSTVCVATEDEEIVEVVRGFDGLSILTSAGLNSGTERLAEVAANALSHVDIFVNVQGDEPEIDGDAIDALIRTMEENPELEMATFAAPIRNARELHDPSCVKVVTDHAGQAVYFSRSPIPYPRGGVRADMFADPPVFFQHVGIYAYRREFLLRFASLPKSPLAELESLEQLAALQAGVKIHVGMLPVATCGIDTQDDYDRFVASQRGKRRQVA